MTRAEERSREILNYVNTAVKEAEDQYRLAEIQRRLDRASFDKVDHAMAHEFRVSITFFVFFLFVNLECIETYN